MTFLHPILLGAGVACVALPIVIHFLMRRRRKPVRWAAMRFLQEAYRQQKRRLQLEQLLLLAARCVLVVLIAVGVARPMLGGGADVRGGGAREVYLLVDNGIGSGVVGVDGESGLAVSVERALAMLRELDAGQGDRAALISLGGPARGVVLPATADLALVERRLRELTTVESGTDVRGGLALVPTAEQAEGEGARTARVVAVYSAFREGSVGAGSGVGAAVAGLVGAELVVSPPAEEGAGNVGLAGVEPLRPVVVTGGAADGVVGVSQVRVRLVRSGASVDGAGRSVVRMLAQTEAGLREVGGAVVSWEAGQESVEVLADVDLGAVSGGASGRVVLMAELEPDANERDNRAWAALEVRERLRVAVVGTRRFGARPRISEFVASDWLALALEPSGASRGDGRSAQIGVEVLDAARVGAGALGGFDAVLVAEPGRVSVEGWGAIGAFSERGGTVLIAASSAVGAQLWVEEATRALGMPWSIGLEPVEVEAGSGGLRASEAGGSAGGDDLLWFIRGELEELARSVSVSRVLGVDVKDAGGVLLETEGRTPVLVVSRGGESGDGERRGLVSLLATAVDLGWTDLPARPLMVPMVQELVRSGAGGRSSVGSVVAGSRVGAPAGAVELVRLGGKAVEDAGGVIAVEAGTGRTREPVRVAGAFEAVDIEGARVGAVAVQPDAQAARAGVSSRERVAAFLTGDRARAGGALVWSDGQRERGGEEAARVRRDTPGPGLMVLLAALALACVELWLARLASHAGVSGGSRGGASA